ncbi:hypothetical protein EJ03DRAFT_325302 [Teratosphaeria nubilosa]|uniref:DUF7603 domain-containing protein n=1 Tax=Teratosphaeria nubilosa TaxID=161662 RepID=A0A6G1LHL7_9PEZI|nr:hypothetical protein EJ03DRAFT_325302 [Teratosphaeria nubilosa]
MAHSRASSVADDYYNYGSSSDDDAQGDPFRDERSVDHYHEYTSPVPLPLQASRSQSLQLSAHAHQQQQHRKQQPANIAVPSFAAFRSSIPTPSHSAARLRQPSFQPAHRARAASVSLVCSPRLANPAARPYSLDSPLPRQSDTLANPIGESAGLLESISHGSSHAHERTASVDPLLAGSVLPNDASSSNYSQSRRSSIPAHSRYPQEQSSSHAPQPSVSSIGYSVCSDRSAARGEDQEEEYMPMHRPAAPFMHIHLDPVHVDPVQEVHRTHSDESPQSDSSKAKELLPKSPGLTGLTSFFGWKSSPAAKPGTESPTTTFSDRSHSPLHSRGGSMQKSLPVDGSNSRGGLTPPILDINKANSHRSIYFDNLETPILLGSPSTNAHVQELERELAQVSSELAGSIRREMDLEDELDRLRAELPNIPHSELTRRNSDYFSDSGASSVKYPVTDPDAKLEEMEQKLRKVEQDKAQLKVEMASRIQDELGRRRDLEQMVHDLEEQLSLRLNQEDAQSEAHGRVEELEASLDETRRRLSQERQAKDNFGNLYSATRLELEKHKNERDNLRDEILPQLRAQIEGLEATAADHQALQYDHARVQQDFAQLRDDMEKLKSQNAYARFTSIAEESDAISPIGGPRSSLSRSNSLARNRSVRGSSITRSNSVKGEGRQRSGSVGPHAVNLDGFKEIEDQRDALHKALKLLISRHDKQQKDHARAIKKLAKEKTRVETLNSSTPRRSAYQREVMFLKEEVTTLRKRTEDALEQKWQYEKGLSGLKMDLDRAEQETRGLRSLLQEHDIIAPNRQSMLSSYSGSDDVQSDNSLKLSVTRVEEERDQARHIAEEYRQRARSNQDASSDELMSSARRMDQLADQLEEQVQLNTQLRDRLAQAVAKGEQEQKESTRQVEEMQKRLAGLEDSVLSAQQHSETTLSNYEAEVRRIEEATSPALQRLRISIPELKKLSLISPLVTKSPKMSRRPSEANLFEAGKTQTLERKVRELERLLKEAEDDMQSVVQRVNRSQMEVAELQTERDAAFTQMRKLQDLISAEREKADALMEAR